MKQNHKIFIRLLVLLGMLAVLLSPVQTARAADCQSAGSGDWSDTGSWTGCGGTGVPTSSDNVYIQSGHTITLDTSGVTNNIVITGTLTITNGNTLSVSGNWSDLGTFTPITGTVAFNGSSGNQTITKSGGESFYKLVVNKSSGNLVLNNNVSLSGNSGDVLTLSGGNLDLNGYTMSLLGNGSYNIRVSGAARTITGTSGSRLYIYSNSGTNTITVASTSSGTLVFDTNVTLEIAGANNVQTKFDPGSSLTTINGTLKISWGGQVVNNGPTYGGSSTLIYSYAYSTSSASYNVGSEWPAGTSGSSIPMNVQLNSAYPDDYSTTTVMPNNSIRNLRGNMTIGSNTTLQLPSQCSPIPSPPGYCGIDIYGNWYNNGGTLYTSSRTIGFKGTSGLQTIGGSATTNFPTLRIDNSSNVVLAHVTVVDNVLYMATGNLDLVGFDLTLGQTAIIYPLSRVSFNATKMVVADNAALCKIFNNVYDPTMYLFPIGDDTGTAEFSPAELDLNFTGSIYGNYSVCVRVIDAKHDELDTTSYATRYWKITNSQGDPPGATFDSTFYYLAGDIYAVSPITEADFYSARYESNNTTWVIYYDQPVNTTDHSFFVDDVTMLNEADYTPVPTKPDAVTVAEIKATPENEQVRLEWTTAQENSVLGFWVYRSSTPDGSGRVPISDFIPSQARSAVGADYEFLDTTAGVGVPYYYWIEMLGSSGSEFFGPLEAILLNQIYLPILRR